MPIILEDRNIILELFKKAFEGFEDFVFIGGINPCSIEFSGVKYNVYIKNLTPAQLSNKNDNIWRIQLPKRKAFEEIKNDSALFLLLGYDKDADVFTTWNPYWAKQRLNVGESVSLYSRHNLQQDACLEEKIIEAELNHNGKVVLFPRTLLPVYIKKINQFFPNETEYIAIGSSLRKNKTPYLSMKNNAQELFLIFTNKDNIGKYEEYLKRNTTLQEKSIKNYIYCLSFLFEKNLFAKNKTLFMPATSYDMYDDILNTFYNTNEDIKKQDVLWHGGIRASLRKYLLFIKNKLADNIVDNQQITDSSDKLEMEEKKQNTNERNVINSNLSGVEITDVSLIDNIISLLKQDPPQTLKCMEALASYFGDNFDSLMSLKQWQQYVVNTDWSALKRKARWQSIASNINSTDAADRLINTILKKYGSIISERKSENYLKLKHLRILSDPKRPSLRIICDKKDIPQFYVKEDSPLMKFYRKGGILIPTNRTGLYSMIYKDKNRVYIIKFTNDGNPYEEGTLLFNP